MAAAAAAVAAAVASAENLAERQLSTALQTVPQLNEVEYHAWLRAIEVVANKDRWHPSILDPTHAAPANPTTKQECDVRNAFALLMANTKNTMVAIGLESCPLGDAVAGFHMVRLHYHPDSQGGKASATNNFYSATMANTNTTISEWLAMVQRRAKNLQAAGGQVDDAAIKTRVLSGLLPEFSGIKLILEQKEPPPTSAQVGTTLRAHAVDNGLAELSKGNKQGSKFNTFAVHDRNDRKPHMLSRQKVDEACKLWGKFKCRYPDCKYNHDGPGGPYVPPAATTTERSNSLGCDYCKSQGLNHVGHTMRGGPTNAGCPVLQAAAKQKTSSAHNTFVKQSHVFNTIAQDKDAAITTTSNPDNYFGLSSHSLSRSTSTRLLTSRNARGH